MIAATSKFSQALLYSHTSLTRVTIDGTVMPTQGGNINADQNRNVRRTGTTTVIREYYTRTAFDAISTASRVVIEKGIEYIDGSVEYVVVATMVVQEMSKNMANTRKILALADDGQFIEDYPLIYAWSSVDGGGVALTYVAAIQQLVADALTFTPTWSIGALVPTTSVTPDGLVWTAGTNRWTAINDLAKAIGCKVFPGPTGAWKIELIGSNTVPVLALNSGAGGALIEAESKSTRRDTFNAVPIEWGNADVQGGVVLVTDDDIASPTYWNGSWGRRPKSTTKVAVTDAAAATAAGRADLALSKGAQSGLNLNAAYNPLLEPSDVISVTPTGAATQLHVLDSLDIALDSSTMTGVTRVVSVS